DIPPSMFRPRPKVYSSLVHFSFNQDREPRATDYVFFIKTVKASFSQRRKKIINCLSSFFRRDRLFVEGVLEDAGIDPDIRAERLGVDKFVLLSNLLYKKLGQGIANG
ncbi:MAG: 16S rRNA (adenine(1518)-N(6)/adenine(1519)-N(6))-dimethyltransferase, partial [Thermodesulfatator sp.]